MSPLAWLRRAFCRHQALRLEGLLEGGTGLVGCRCGWAREVELPPRVDQVRAMVRLELSRARVQAAEAVAQAEGRPLPRLERLRLRGDAGLLFGGKRGGW